MVSTFWCISNVYQLFIQIVDINSNNIPVCVITSIIVLSFLGSEASR